MRRETRHVLVFVVFVLLTCVGIGNILFATHWLLPDDFFSDWDPYDHLFDRTFARREDADAAAAPLLADYGDDLRFQVHTRKLFASLWHGQDDNVRTWRNWLRGGWRAAVTGEVHEEAADMPMCPWEAPSSAGEAGSTLPFSFPLMQTPRQFAEEQYERLLLNTDVMAQLQLRYSPDSRSTAPDRHELSHHRVGGSASAGHPAEDERHDGAPERVSWSPLSDRPGDGQRRPPPDYQTIVEAIDTNVTWSRKVRYFASPRTRAARPPQHPWTHFYIALNLYENEKMLPYLTAALVAWLEDELSPFFDLASSVVVSIYANKANQQDQTGELIRTLLIPELHRVGVEEVYATTSGTCLGMANKSRAVERIEWMACVRNKAMTPLYAQGMRLFPNRTDHTGGSAASADGLVVLFLNDIFFRPVDLTRLLESRVEPGMRSATLLADGVLRTGDMAPPAEASAVSSPLWPGFDMACGMDFYFNFYDTWVTRDRHGHTFRASMPYAKDAVTQEAFQRIFNGLRNSTASRHQMDREAAGDDDVDVRRHAVPVKCCWNGVAAIRGRFFLPDNVDDSDRGDDAGDDEVSSVGCDEDAHGGEPSGTNSGGPRKCTALTDLPADEPLTNHSAVHEWLSAYFLRLQLRRLSADRVNWAQKCAKTAKKHRAAVTELELSGHSLFADDIPTLLHATQQCARAAESRHLRGGRVAVNSSAADVFCAPHTAEPPTGDNGSGGFVPRGTLYRARRPAVRFRHASVPSYGAMHAARTASATTAPRERVVDNVCLSSECHLVCLDVQSAALLRDRRLPVILLNPTVRVVYEADDLDRVVLGQWYESPWLYWLARRVVAAESHLGEGVPHPWRSSSLRWWRLLWPSHWSVTWGAEATATTSTARRYSPKVHMRPFMDASDDWLRPDLRDDQGLSELVRVAVPPTVPVAQAAKEEQPPLSAVVVVNVTQLTRMDCLDDVLTDRGEPPLVMFVLFRFAVLGAVCALLWLCCHWANADARAATTPAFIAVHVGRDAVGARGEKTSVSSPLFVPSLRGVTSNVDAVWWLRGRRAVHAVRGRLQRGLTECSGWWHARVASLTATATSPLSLRGGGGAVGVSVKSPTTPTPRADPGWRRPGGAETGRPFPAPPASRPSAASARVPETTTSAVAINPLKEAQGRYRR